LGEWINQYTSVAVTGSHGKTSTTGLLAHVLEQSLPTSYLIGDGTGKDMKIAIILRSKHVNISDIFFIISLITRFLLILILIIQIILLIWMICVIRFNHWQIM